MTGRHKGPAEPKAHQDNVRAVKKVTAGLLLLLGLAGLAAVLIPLLGLPSHAVVRTAAAHPVKHVSPPAVIRHPARKAVITYTVKEGDNLWGIAQSRCGNGNDWHALYDANKKVITDWNLVQPGTKLVIAC